LSTENLQGHYKQLKHEGQVWLPGDETKAGRAAELTYTTTTLTALCPTGDWSQ